MSKQPEWSSTRRAAGRFLREVIAPLAWTYALLKIAVFDVDVYVVRWFAPRFEWLLAYRFFGLLAMAVALLLALGPRDFLVLLAFIPSYPFVVLFWKVPKHFYRQWPVILVFLPAIGSAVSRLWSTILLYSLATFSGLFILASHRRWLIVGAVGGLVPLLVVHLWRSLKKAYSSSLLTRLSGLVGKLRKSIASGTFAPWSNDDTTTATSAKGDESPTQGSPRQVAYIFHGAVAFIAEHVRSVTQRRYYDVYLITSWFYTVVLTTILFGLAHYGIHKAMPGAYSDADNAGFLSFIGLSLGILTTSTVSKIAPVSALANLLSYSEVLCSVIILVILVFSVLTAAREAFKDDLDLFASELGGIATVLEERVSATWQLSMAEFERAVLVENALLVNALRRARGLPELPKPSVTPQIGSPRHDTGNEM